MYKGLFISFEGIDGTGKSTQVVKLAAALTELGYSIHRTKEPGDRNTGSSVGDGVRELVFKYPSTKNMAPGVADMLFLADHIQNASDIRQELQAGKVVLTDRYADSQFAYAGSATKRCPAWTLKLFQEQFGPVPDITVLILVRGENSQGDVGWALERANARRGAEAGKQDGKAWNDIAEQLKIQHAYIDRLLHQQRTLAIWVKEEDSPAQIHQVIFDGVLARIQQMSARQQMILPMYAAVEKAEVV